MELRNMFPNLNGNWIRWSDYRISDNRGVKYIKPTETALALPYSCTDSPEQMVVGALNLGKLVFEQKDKSDEACLSFARKYGPLGVILPVKSPLLDNGRNADNSRGAAPVYCGIFAKSYGEPLERYQDTLRTLYIHFLMIKEQGDKLSQKEQKQLRKQELTPESCSMNYRLTFGTPPQLVWEPENLLAVLKLCYAIAVSDPASPLKLCKSCGEAYYNPNSRSEFCSVKCRNYFNVKAFRGRRREQE
ncbi:MAG: hypothetical protein PHE26_06850 [Syntrophomonadaceae bacterium]|nr:hypothetical protein [Syntrophomonadaceae bacterium]